MPVNIPISGDPSALIRSLQQIQSTLRQMGADAKAFENIDLSHPEVGGLTDDLRRVIANFEQLTKIGRGHTASSVRGVLRSSGAGNAAPQEQLVRWLEEANRAFVDPGERQRHIGNVGRYVMSGTRFAPPASSGGGGGGDDGDDGEDGGSGSGGRNIGSSITSGVSNAMKAASKEFIGALLAYGAVKGVGASTGQAISQGLAESSANDVFMRTIQGAASDFDSLRQSVRETTRGLYLTVQEGQQLSEQFAKLTNETDPAKISAGVRTAAGFARAYGLDPTATNGAFASAKYLGEDPRQFADLIAAAVSQGNMTGQSDQVSQAILSWIQQSSRLMLVGNGAASMASLYAGMNATGSPMLKGDNGLALLSSANQAIMQGGGGGMAGQVVALQALANNGISNPYWASLLLQGGAFATPASMNVPGAKDPNQTNYASIKARVDAMYPGADNPMRWTALGMAFGWTPAQARAMDGVNPADLGYMAQWMAAHGMDPNSMNPTSIQDINSVLRPGADLQAWRKRVLAQGSGYTLDVADTQGLMSATTPDALKAALVKALNDSGMSQTPATQQQQAVADLSNNLTDIGSKLIPAVTDLTTAVQNLTAEIDASIIVQSPYAPVPGLAPFHGPGNYQRPAATGLSPAMKSLISTDVTAAAGAYGLDPNWMNGIVAGEGWNGQDIPNGGIGPMGLTATTAGGLGVNPHDLISNIVGGTAYFRNQLKAFGGYYDVAAAAYTEGQDGPGIQQFYNTGDESGLTQAARDYIKNIEASYQASGGNLATLHLRADPVVVVIKTPQGQVVGKAAINLQGRAVPSGQRP